MNWPASGATSEGDQSSSPPPSPRSFLRLECCVGIWWLGFAVWGFGIRVYRGTSLIRKRTPLGPYCRSMPRVVGGHKGVGVFL